VTPEKLKSLKDKQRVILTRDGLDQGLRGTLRKLPGGWIVEVDFTGDVTHAFSHEIEPDDSGLRDECPGCAKIISACSMVWVDDRPHHFLCLEVRNKILAGEFEQRGPHAEYPIDVDYLRRKTENDRRLDRRRQKSRPRDGR
jgi:hypothetical protein